MHHPMPINTEELDANNIDTDALLRASRDLREKLYTGEKLKYEESREFIIDRMRQSMMSQLSLSLWAYDKQVFTFSDELINEFISFGIEQDNGIPIKMLKNIPFKSICIDVSENDIVNIEGIKLRYLIVSPFFVNDNFYYSQSFYAKDGEYSFFTFEVKDISKLNENAEMVIRDNNKGGSSVDPDGYFTIIGLNCLLYLVSNKPDIMENEIQKKIYHPSSSIKNKMREIRKWDVGFRYADSIKKQYIQEGDGKETRHGKSSSKRPHVRKAHWHRYWIGHGEDKHLELRWVSSCHINAEFVSDLPVVSHKEI